MMSPGLIFFLISIGFSCLGWSCGDGTVNGYEELILVNNEVEVGVGKRVIIRWRRDLWLGPREPGANDSCVVRVLHDDPSGSWLGKLSPSEFPCKFQTGSVTYTHYGSRSFSDDRVRLLLRYDNDEDTAIVPFVLKIKVQLLPKTFIAHQKSVLQVRQSGGQSQVLDTSVLQLKYDRSRYFQCHIKVHRGAGVTFPRYGRLQNVNGDFDDSLTYNCESFYQEKLFYQHSSPNDSQRAYLNKDHVPLMVEISDWLNEGQAVREHVQLVVGMEDGLENSPPRLNEASLLLMNVNQFVLTSVTTDVLSADDEETDSKELVFRLTTHDSGHAMDFEGQLINTDDQYVAIDRFTQKDIEQLKIAYKPPNSNANGRQIIPIAMEIVDGDGLNSETFTLLITVNPMNSNAPLATTNTGLSLFEGQSRRLQTGKNLEISDADNIDDVSIHVIHGLKHGKLLLMEEEIAQFRAADLDAGLIRYQHDGSESYADNIVFRLDDGEHAVELLFTITIFPVDDQPPFLVVNTGLTLHKSLEAEIGPYALSASDTDSEDDEDIQFILEKPGPSYGQLFIRFYPEENEDEEEPEEEVVASGWSQRDIMEGKLYYRHLGQHHSQVVMDAINFRLRDNHLPPNLSKEYQFLVKILPMDDIPPLPHPEATFTLTVREFELTVLSSVNLRFTDHGASGDDRWLVYTQAKAMYDLDQNNMNAEVGRLVSIDEPEVSLQSFTQAQINHRKIAYQPPPVELGLTTRIIRWEFDVEDEAGNVADGHSINIKLLPVNNKPPTVYNVGLKVAEGSEGVIGTHVIDVNDVDTEAQHLWFRVVSEPRHGRFLRNSSALLRGDFFSRTDLVSNALTYVHDGSEHSDDEMNAEVSDGVHIVPFTLRFSVQMVDDQQPFLVSKNRSVTLFCNEGSFVVFPADLFGATDADTDDDKLIYEIETLPTYGHIGTHNKNRSDVLSFSQRQLKQGNVIYRHSGDEIGEKPITDNFLLNLSDRSNVGQQINVSVAILTVNNQPPNVTILVPLLVPEGGKVIISSDNLLIDDADSIASDIVCTIINQPARGYLENTSPLLGSEQSQVGLAITAFRLINVQQSSINYVQSIHWNEEPVSDSLTIECSDGVNVSPAVTLDVEIEPTNDETPQLIIGKLEVIEGMPLHIDHTVLNAVDNDIPQDDLTFNVSRKPRHGRIIFQSVDGSTEISSFDVEQLQLNNELTLVYLHDDSESLEDDFELQLHDGNALHTITKLVKLTIVPTDDETPTLAINRGLEMKVGEEQIINHRVLKATDVDSHHETLVYILKTEPRHGQLLKVDRSAKSNLTLNSTFTQNDINNGVILYMHIKEEGAGRDFFKFDVTDGVNYLIDRFFYITIEGGDLMYPEVVNRGVTLNEGGRVTLTTDVLSTSDIDSDNRWLTFVITRNPSKGHLESSERNGQAINRFTQLDVAGNKIMYVHTSDDESKVDSFEFEVCDGHNSIYRTFRVTVNSVENKMPVVFIVNQLLVTEGGTTSVTPFELKAEDTDTKPEEVRFMVVKSPSHGKLLLDGKEMQLSRGGNLNFSMAEVNAGKVSYRHDDSETKSDALKFTVTDGSHDRFFVYPDVKYHTSRPVTLKITVLPVDDEPPQLIRNKPSNYVTYFSQLDDRLGSLLHPNLINTMDVDSPLQEVRYVVTVEPQHGRIIHQLDDKENINSFTQGDVNSKNIYYILSDGTNVTDDAFSFKLVDNGGNENGEYKFILRWSWISIEEGSYVVNETEPYLKLFLKRRGYLGETVFVGVDAVDVTAVKGRDFRPVYANQVQFGPGQSKASWKLPLMDDSLYEGPEQLMILLKEPVMTAIELDRFSALVTIADDEDEPVVYLSDEKILVNENEGEVLFPVKRKGDLSTEMTLFCITKSGSATETKATNLTSFSDYIGQKQFVRFQINQTQAICSVIIMDDSLFEFSESFYLRLVNVSGGRTGAYDSTEIIIQPDKNDDISVFFEHSNYTIGESDEFLHVTIKRRGSDLNHKSSVIVQSRQISAEAGADYYGIDRVIGFDPGIDSYILRVRILDDVNENFLEGLETFSLILKPLANSTLGTQNETIITIEDNTNDVPSVQFKESGYVVEEGDGRIIATLRRQGDLSKNLSVRCYTRQMTAQVQLDFLERPNTDSSIIYFVAGESENSCTVELINDGLFEGDEQFHLALSMPSHHDRFKIGPKNVTTVTIKDSNDMPGLGFEKSRYDVREPKHHGQLSIVEVAVVRNGDINRTATFRVNTKDGSAKSNEDYVAFSKEVTMDCNISRAIVPIEILYDEEREQRETFILQLKSFDIKTRQEKRLDAKVVIYIESDVNLAVVTFPAKPVIISLRDYEENSISVTTQEIAAGYPIVCITSCNSHHPEFHKTNSLCQAQGVNDLLTEFEWRVMSADGTISEIRDATFFTRVDLMTLDSIYLSADSSVQCAVRAVGIDSSPGIQIHSQFVKVSNSLGICRPRIEGLFGSEPFTAKLKYTGTEDAHHPNMVKLSVIIPHRDGLLPLISTFPLSSFHILLNRDLPIRSTFHPCSNLLNHPAIEEPKNSTKISLAMEEAEPNQFNSILRSEPTLRFYHNLDLESCTWEFNSYYSMSDLVNMCGATITNNDGQIRNESQSYVNVRFPLYVSYVFYSGLLGGWQHTDHHTQLIMRFVYDTSAVWRDGISAVNDQSKLQAVLYPTSMRIEHDGRLLVHFVTEVKFNGKLLLKHPELNITSVVVSPQHPDLTFSLMSESDDEINDSHRQQWFFLSDYAVKDYSGMYHVKIVPCVFSPSSEFCIPRDEPINFELGVRFQQLSDSVAAEYSLSTRFQLSRHNNVWLGLEKDANDISFQPEDVIYGRLLVDPVQNMGSTFGLQIERCVLCCGVNGYVPKYNPSLQEYGCLARSSHLMHTINIIDKRFPQSVDTAFYNVPLNARLLSQHNSSHLETNAFQFDAAALFMATSGRQWFVHCVFNIQSKKSRHRRSANDENYELFGGIGEDGRGTNMHPFHLAYYSDTDIWTENQNFWLNKNTQIVVAVTTFILVIIAFGVLGFKRQCRPVSTETSCPQPNPTNTRILTKKPHFIINDDNTEV